MIQQLVAELPEQWRQVLLLRINGELSYEEISQVVGCTVSQVRTWIYRGRRELEKKLLEKEIIEAS